MRGFLGKPYVLILFFFGALGLFSRASADDVVPNDPVWSMEKNVGKMLYSRDGRSILIVQSGNLSLWDVSTRKELWRRDAYAWSAYFSSDGKRIVATNYNEVVVLDAKDGNLIKRVATSSTDEEIGSATVSPDDSLLFVVRKTKAEVWDLNDGKLQFRLSGSGYFYGGDLAKFSPDSSILVVRDGDVVKAYNARTGRKLWQADSKGYAWEFVDRGQKLLVSHAGSLEVIRTDDWRRISSRDVRGFFTEIRYFPSSDLLLARDLEAVYLFKWEGFSLLKKVAVQPGVLKYPVELSSNGHWLAVATSQNELWLYDLSHDSGDKLIKKNVAVVDLAFSPHAHLLVSSEKETIEFWDSQTGLQAKTGSQPPMDGVKAAPSPRLAVTLGHTGEVKAADVSPDGRLLLTGGDDSARAHLWHIETGNEICQAGSSNGNSQIKAVKFFPDLRRMIVADSSRGTSHLRIFRTEDCQLEKQIQISEPKSIDISPNGLYVLIAGGGGVDVLETEQWKTVKSFNAYNAALKAEGEYNHFDVALFANNNQIVLTNAYRVHLLPLTAAAGRGWSASVPKSYRASWGSDSPNGVKGAAVDEERGVVSVVADDGVLYQFSLADGKVLAQGRIGEFASKGLTFLSNGDIVTADQVYERSASLDRLKVWSKGKKSPTRELTWTKDETSISGTFAMFSTGSDLIAVRADGKVTILNAKKELYVERGFWLAGKTGPVQSVEFSRDGRRILAGLRASALSGVASVFDLQSGSEAKVPGTFIKDYVSGRNAAADAPDYPLATRARFVSNDSVVTVNARALQMVNLLNMQQTIIEQRQAMIAAMPVVAVSPNQGEFISTFGVAIGRHSVSGDVTGQNLPWKFDDDGMSAPGMWGVIGVAFSTDGKLAISISTEGQRLALWDVKQLKLIRRFGAGVPRATAVVFSEDGNSVFSAHADLSIRQWSIETGKELRTIRGSFATMTSLRRLGGNNFVVGSKDGSIRVWDIQSGVETERYEGQSGGVNDVAVSKDGKFIAGAYDDGSVLIWKKGSPQWLAKYISFADGIWFVTTPDGRYDSNSPGDLPGVSWIMPDDPLTPLPVEIFMKEYYEPRLLARIMAGEEFPPIKSLSETNRVQPKVKIVGIRRGRSSNTVAVQVEVSGNSKTFSEGGKKVFRSTGVYDLRLFRDGQLVAYAPQKGGQVKLDRKTGRSIITFPDIKLPTGGQEKVEFSSYAFNIDGIKSSTVKADYRIPGAAPKRIPRAYVISIGVNRYQNSAWNLQYAADDAQSMQTVIPGKLEQSGRFAAGDVIAIPLISREGDEQGATKARIRAVFDLLAGKRVAPALVASIPGADKIRPANPEDTVIITYSGHGYADAKREFYLFPHDFGSGSKRSIAPGILKRLISSDELSLWLRDVDAGDMSMIIDACNSAASVEGTDFRPGPMGSRGLGQLAYDKGMRILTASQAESVALESALIRHGVLSYALVQEGIEQHLADYLPADHRITIDEWLKYGVKRVPVLNEEIAAGSISSAGRGLTLVSGDARDRLSPYAQQPSLFDFNKRSPNSLLLQF